MHIMGTTIVSAFSGADSAIFEGMRSCNHLVDVIDASLPDWWKIFFLATSFYPSKPNWYKRWQHKMTMQPLAYKARTYHLNRKLRSRLCEYDILLQIGGLFAPFQGPYPVPVTLFCDYTTKLAELNYPRWFGLNGIKADLWYELEADLYHNCSMIFTATDNTRNSLIKHYKIDPLKVRTVGEGVNSIQINTEKRYDEFIVLFVGIDFERKGGATILKAFSQVKACLPQARLLVAGPSCGPAQPGVEWLGHIADRNQVQQLFSKATVFAMPSVCEPFGLALIEAMSHGLPVIGSTADAMAEIIDDGLTGFLVPVGDHNKLAAQLILLLTSPDLCAKFGTAGKQKVEDQFLWQKVVTRIDEGLKIVMGDSPLL